MLQIQKKFVNRNFTPGNFNKKYIVIHETDNECRGANADANYRNCKNNNVGASSQFFVDDKNIIQIMDIGAKAWAVGKRYGTPEIKDVTNANTINIEICVNRDGDYNKARQNAIELTKWLINITKIPTTRVIRHYDGCKKWCPRKMLDDSSLWNDFKRQISGKNSNNITGRYGIVTASVLNVRETNSIDSKTIRQLRKGEKVKIYKQYNDWYSIYPTGCIYKKYIKLI